MTHPRHSMSAGGVGAARPSASDAASASELAGSPLGPPPPLDDGLVSRWMLDPAIDFLNHGSFGAMPQAVADAQSHWRGRIEARPIALLGRACASLLAMARRAVGALIGAEADDLGFVTNATEGINAYLASVPLRAGDEILTTDHVYNAVRQAMRHRAAVAEATMREISIPLPLAGPHQVVERIVDALTDRTRLLVIDHVTSPTALRFPIEEIASQCAQRGIDVLVDGAHAPGMIEVDMCRLADVGVTGYAANLHKWVCAPKGSGFLWVRPDRQAHVHPVVVSHFLGEGFREEFEWQGTRDITPWLCAADAIVFLEGFGLPKIMAHNGAMARWMQRMLCDAWGVEPVSPGDGSMIGSMATVLLPEALQPSRQPGGVGDLPPADIRRRRAVEAIQAIILDRYAIEVPVVDFGNRWHVRPCCQVYNTADQYRRLASALTQLASEGGDVPVTSAPPPAPTRP